MSAIPMTAQPGPYERSLREAAIAARRRLTQAGAPVDVIQRLAMLAATPETRPYRKPEPAKMPAPKPRLNILSIEEIPGPFRWRAILDEVCAKHRITKEQICSHQRNREIVAARFEAYYRLSTETTMSLPQIGRALGGKDHTSVLHGIRTHKARMTE